MRYLAYKVASDLQNRYRFARRAEPGDKTIPGQQVVLECDPWDIKQVVTLERNPLTGNLSTDHHAIRVVGGTHEEDAMGPGPNPPSASRAPESVDHSGRRASWVIREKATGGVVFETFSEKVAAAINTEKYEVIAVADHLEGLNKSIKTDAQPEDEVVDEFSRPMGGQV